MKGALVGPALALLFFLIAQTAWAASHEGATAPPGQESQLDLLNPDPGGGPGEEEQPFLSGEGDPKEEGAQGGTGKSFSFDHRYRVEGSGNKTTGLLNFLTGSETVRLLRLVHSYQQTIRIEDSATKFNFVKFSINFTQSYEAESQQFLDNQVLFNEIYHELRGGNHRVRWGNQVLRLGKVDFGSPIDVLHVQDLFSLMTFDLRGNKKSLTAVRYQWVSASRTFTFYSAPVGQRTFGMKFTRFREDAEKRDRGEDPEGELLLRDYAGVQHQWRGRSFDLRLGLFHWFDRNPSISWRFTRPPPGEFAESFRGLFDTFREEETQTNFATLELDAQIGGLGWKLDMGYFDQKNFYDYRVEENGSVNFDTVSVPFFGLASSWELQFQSFFVLFAYSYEFLNAVPANTHVLFFENESAPLGEERDLEKQGVTTVFLWRWGARQKATFILGHSAPFETSHAVAAWSWESPQKDSGEWSVRLLRFETAEQKFTGKPIESSQLSVGYTVFFSGLRSG